MVSLPKSHHFDPENGFDLNQRVVLKCDPILLEICNSRNYILELAVHPSDGKSEDDFRKAIFSVAVLPSPSHLFQHSLSVEDSARFHGEGHGLLSVGKQSIRVLQPT